MNVKGCSGTMPKTKPFFWFLFSTTVTVGMLKFHNFHYLLLIFFFAKFLSFLFIIQPTKIQVKNFGGLKSKLWKTVVTLKKTILVLCYLKKDPRKYRCISIVFDILRNIESAPFFSIHYS